MSSQPDLGQALVTAITNIITAIAGVIGGVANALSEYANTIGTVLVAVGLAYFVWRGVERIAPFVRGLIARFI